MEKLKKVFAGRVGGIALCVLQIVVGVLLLIDPVGFTSGIIIGAGALLTMVGVFHAVRYFMVQPETGRQTQLLFKGITLMLAGVTCMTQYGWFLTAFPLLTVVYAGWMLILAAMKVQQMADMLRTKSGRWYLPAIAAALAAVLAAVILINPFGAAAAVWTFVAISLIAEAIVEMIGAILK